MIQKLGNNFSKSTKLNLLPGLTLPKGYWQLHVSATIENGPNVAEMSSGTTNCGGEERDWDIIMAPDVYNVQVKIHRHNSFPGNPNTIIVFNIRADHLILLNLAYKLLKVPVEL